MNKTSAHNTQHTPTQLLKKLPDIICTYSQKVLDRLHWHRQIGLLISVTLFTLATSWLADSFPIHSLEETNLPSGTIALMLTILSLILFNCYKSTLCNLRVKSQNHYTPHPAIITFLSASKPIPWETLTPNLEIDLNNEQALKQPSWRQQMRLIARSTSTLKHIYLITSHQSHPQKDDFTRLVHHYHPEISIQEITTHGIDFENLETIVQTLKTAIQQAMNDGYHKTDIIIDVTGGQKTTSIAAANVTMEDHNLEFCYVQSQQGDKFDILSYNATSDKAEAPA